MYILYALQDCEESVGELYLKDVIRSMRITQRIQGGEGYVLQAGSAMYVVVQYARTDIFIQCSILPRAVLSHAHH